VPAAGQGPHTPEQWFATGPPELLSSNVALTPLMTWSEYTALAGNLRGPRFVPLTERPALSENARFAFNFVLGGKNRTLAVDGTREAGYRLYLDIDGDGTFTAGEALTMTQVAGRFSATFHAELTDTSSGSAETYPVEMTFALDTAIPPGETVPIPVIRRSGTTVRRGVVHLTGLDVPFA